MQKIFLTHRLVFYNVISFGKLMVNGQNGQAGNHAVPPVGKDNTYVTGLVTIHLLPIKAELVKVCLQMRSCVVDKNVQVSKVICVTL